MDQTYTHVLSAYAYLKTGDTEDYEATPFATGINATVVPASSTTIAVMGIPSFDLYEIFIQDPVNLKMGQKLSDGTDTYIIKHIRPFNNTPIPHLQIVGEKKV